MTKSALELIPKYDSESIYPHKKVLSSSQVLMYLKDPALFYTTYVLGVPYGSESKAMNIGRIFSALYEDRSFPFREALAEAGAPKRVGDLFEKVIDRMPVVPAEVKLVVKHRGWGFRITLDGFAKKEATIIENKTGQNGWTQERVEKDPQLTLQAWGHLKKFKKLPKKIILNYIDTSARPTMELRTFATTRKKRDVMECEEILDLVVAGIEAENWTRNVL